MRFGNDLASQVRNYREVHANGNLRKGKNINSTVPITCITSIMRGHIQTRAASLAESGCQKVRGQRTFWTTFILITCWHSDMLTNFYCSGLGGLQGIENNIPLLKDKMIGFKLSIWRIIPKTPTLTAESIILFEAWFTFSKWKPKLFVVWKHDLTFVKHFLKHCM